MFSRCCFSWVKKFFAFYFVIIGKCSTFASAFKEKTTKQDRGVAQLASALAWGARGRKFESSRPD